MVEPDLRRRARGRVARLPAQRRRPADAHGLPGPRLGRGKRRESPKTNGTLFLTFSDNRNGTHDSDNPVTNSDVFVVSSTNGGSTWTAPAQVDAGAGDQWFPWIDVDPTNGSIGVLYHDRGASNGPLYNTALAEGTLGSLVKTTLSTAPSNPTNSIFFQAGVSGCEKCATFHGDYIGLSYSSTGVAYAAWTDMREFRPVDGGYAQSIFFVKK
jgi:hypothetical protein